MTTLKHQGNRTESNLASRRSDLAEGQNRRMRKQRLKSKNLRFHEDQHLSWQTKQVRQGDAPDIVRDSITKVTLFDYSDIIAADDDEEEDNE